MSRLSFARSPGRWTTPSDRGWGMPGAGASSNSTVVEPSKINTPRSSRQPSGAQVTTRPRACSAPGRTLRRRDGRRRRYLRRLLGSGGAAAPERESLALLPSGPDAVRTLPVRGTRSVNAARADPVPSTPPLGRRSAPHGADFGFREPLTPHLARPGAGEVTRATDSLDGRGERHAPTQPSSEFARPDPRLSGIRKPGQSSRYGTLERTTRGSKSRIRLT